MHSLNKCSLDDFYIPDARIGVGESNPIKPRHSNPYYVYVYLSITVQKKHLSVIRSFKFGCEEDIFVLSSIKWSNSMA